MIGRQFTKIKYQISKLFNNNFKNNSQMIQQDSSSCCSFRHGILNIVRAKFKFIQDIAFGQEIYRTSRPETGGSNRPATQALKE